MTSTMETWAKLVGVGATLKGGIEGANKQLKKLSPEARAERLEAKLKKKEDKEQRKVKRELSKELLREHGSWMQGIQDTVLGHSKVQKQLEAQEIAVRHHTAKMQAELDAEKKSEMDSAHDEAIKMEIEGTQQLDDGTADDRHRKAIQDEIDDDKKKELGRAHDEARKMELLGTHLQKEEHIAKIEKINQRSGSGSEAGGGVDSGAGGGVDSGAK